MKKTLLLLLMVLFIFSVDAIANKKNSLNNKKKENLIKSVSTFNTDVNNILGLKIKNSAQINFSFNHWLTVSFSPEKSTTTEDSTLDVSIDYEYENNIINESYSEVINNQLVESAYNTFYYSNNLTQLDSMIFKDLDTVSNQIVNDYKVIYSFESGLRALGLAYEFDPISGSWENSSKTIYQYDQSNNLLREDFYYWPDIDTNWTILTKTDYLYESDLVIQTETSYWDEGSLSWNGSYKEIFNYDAQNNIVEAIDSTWDYTNSAYNPLFLEKMIYTNNQLDTIVSFEWDNTYLAWAADWVQINNYNTEGLLMSEDEYIEVPAANPTKSYSSEEKPFEKNYSWIYTYKQPVFNKKIAKTHIFSVYPNPAAETVNIRIQNPNNCRLHVFNIQGKLMLNQKINSSVTSIPTQNFKSGAYIFRITNNGKTTSQTIIKQ